MGIDLGSLAPVIGGGGKEDTSIFKLTSDLLGTAGNFLKAIGYFTGEGFQEALAGGFMK